MNYVSVWSHGAEHTRMWCKNSKLSLSLLGAVMGWGQCCQAMQGIEFGGSGGLIKGQESSEMVVCPDLQRHFESLLKPRKESSVAATPFPNPPATPVHTSHLDQVRQVQTLLAAGRG